MWTKILLRESPGQRNPVKRRLERTGAHNAVTVAFFSGEVSEQILTNVSELPLQKEIDGKRDKNRRAQGRGR